MSVIDVVTFNGERELFDLRYNILKDHVDEFVVIEFDKTFSGEPRVINEESISFFWQYDKVTHRIHTEEDYEKYREMAEQSPNTVGADHWKREFMQKESIKDAISHAKDEDILFIGDVDEIWNPKYTEYFKVVSRWGIKNHLKVYTYYLNNSSTERFWGTYVGRFSPIKDSVLNHLRSHATKPQTDKEYDNSGELVDKKKKWPPTGWHFTSMGGPEVLKKKLTDSYTQESYATPQILGNLAYNIEQSKDFLGRNFTYALDESEWPQYLKDNRDKYKHLIK